MRRGTRQGPQSEAGPPTAFPQGTPTGGHDHSFTLQAVMEMTKTLGGLGEKIDRLRTDVDDLGKKVDANTDKVAGINTKLAWVAGIAAGVAAVFAIIWAVMGLVPWDRITIAPAEQAAQKEGAAEAAPVVEGSAQKGSEPRPLR